MYCKHCGNKIPDDAIFCPNCGTKINCYDCASGEDASGRGDAPQSFDRQPASDTNLILPAFTLVFYLLIYPIGLILNIVGLFGGERKGCFWAMFVLFFLIPIFFAALIFCP